MSKIANTNRRKTIIIFLLCATIFTIAQSANAAWGLETLSGTGLPTGSPAEFISRVVNYVLGFVGIVLIVILIYGGFLYLTSAGNEKQIETAKKVLTYAIIGMVIIFASYIIANYTIKALTTSGTQPPVKMDDK